MNRVALVTLFAVLIHASVVIADGSITVMVKRGDSAALIQAIESANAQPNGTTTFIQFTGPAEDFIFVEPYMNSDNALPVITSRVQFLDGPATFRRASTATGPFRFVEIGDAGNLTSYHTNFAFSDFAVGQTENGGAFLVHGSGGLRLEFATLEDNSAGGYGGAIYRDGTGPFLLQWCDIHSNSAGASGGAISYNGQIAADQIEPVFLNGAAVKASRFWGNQSGLEGSALHINAGSPDPGLDLDLFGNSVTHTQGNVLIENPLGKVRFVANTVVGGNDVINSTGTFDMASNILGGGNAGSNQLRRAGAGHSKPEAACNDFGFDAFNSFGHNIATDASCALDGPGDLPDTDPLIADSSDGDAPTPMPGSPAIDLVPAGVLNIDGETVLPCSWRDITGLGRPQDGDGDGEFECDAGAVEAPGTGAIQAGHSGAFYNSLRNGEGQYVEVLDGGLALVYTFTFRPDGSGPAWLLGVARVVGNSLVMDDVLRPTGTSFGDGFDTGTVEFSEWGGMSIVFPGCSGSDPAGGIAFSGNPGLGYEALISRAERITNIAGCGGNVVPNANAGLSGSYYAIDRNGEGVIVEWLPDGRVLAIMFTFDLAGNQMWIFGTGTANGKSVTIDALYPTGFTSWGSGFDPGEVTLESWGTFMLTWTDCDHLQFQYASTVNGYGSATRNYQRITHLAGLDCPEF